ncbi:hypothetical protein D9M68_662200 [compost metagenome]
MHLEAVRIALPRHHLQPACRATHNQRLARTDEDILRTVVLRNDADAYIGGQLANSLVASIEQVVGLLAVGSGNRNRVIHTGDGTGKAIDLIRYRRHLFVGETVLLVEAVVDGVEAPRQTFRLG